MLELLGDHRRPGRRPTGRGHRRVQPTQTRSRSRTRPGRRRPAAPRCAPAAGRAPRVVASTPDRIAGASNDACPSARCDSHHGAVLEELRLDRRQPDDRRVLHRRRHIDHPLQRPPPPPPTPPTTRTPPTAANAPPKLDQGGLTRRRNLHRTPDHHPHPPAVSLRRSYRRPLTDPWSDVGAREAASSCTTTRLKRTLRRRHPLATPSSPLRFPTPSPSRDHRKPLARIQRWAMYPVAPQRNSGHDNATQAISTRLKPPRRSRPQVGSTPLANAVPDKTGWPETLVAVRSAVVPQRYTRARRHQRATSRGGVGRRAHAAAVLRDGGGRPS